MPPWMPSEDSGSGSPSDMPRSSSDHVQSSRVQRCRREKGSPLAFRSPKPPLGVLTKVQTSISVRELQSNERAKIRWADVQRLTWQVI